MKQECGETLGELEPVYNLFTITGEITLPQAVIHVSYARKRNVREKSHLKCQNNKNMKKEVQLCKYHNKTTNRQFEEIGWKGASKEGGSLRRARRNGTMKKNSVDEGLKQKGLKKPSEQMKEPN